MLSVYPPLFTTVYYKYCLPPPTTAYAFKKITILQPLRIHYSPTTRRHTKADLGEKNTDWLCSQVIRLKDKI